MYQITKDFRFEAAHRLAKGYVGKCANIHGHSWNGHITLECKELDAQDMTLDFSEVGAFLKLIEGILDHKLILCKKDEALINFLKKEKEFGLEGIVIVEQNPTCEALAKYIYNKAVAWFDNANFVQREMKVVSVTIKETCTTSCTYSESLPKYIKSLEPKIQLL